jgi:universal stress protein E
MPSPFLARRLDAAIIAMGVVARPALKRLLIGSTAERVLDRLSCDVLVVKTGMAKSQIAVRRRGLRFMASAIPPM